ncbi:putative ribonuclease H-like domain-containing protein [Tanacetum coccineum]
MDQDSAHVVAASKVPMLKPGEFELWRMRIEQYIHEMILDMPLWKVIENGATLPKTKCPKWSATTATRRDILLGSAELQEIKTIRTRKAQEGVCMWKHLLPQLWCHVMVLVDITGVIRQRKGLIMHSWLTRLLSSDSEVSNDSNCSKSCMETVKLLGSQNDQLLRDLEKSSLMVLGYKTGLESVEEKLEFYKKNEPVYVANINGLKWDIQVREITISELNEFVNKPVVENRKSDEEVSKGNPQMDLQDKGVIDSGCSRHMTENMFYLTDYEDIDGGYVAFGGNPKGGKITRKCTIKTGNLDFENVYFVRELKFNLFSVSQMCDKKNNVLFNDTECIVLSPNFKLIDESQVLLRVPRKNNMYSVDLKNIVPKRGLTFLFAKATSDESKLWHRRLGHLNFKTMNKLVKGNLVRGLPSKLFENDQTCVACQKGKQHRASCKTKIENSISLPLHLLHMDLFGPTFVKSLMKKMYCLVVTDDYSRFTWVFFLATKDETSGILKSFITGIENLVDHKVKVIRCDNGTEFKNREMNQFCEMKGKFDGKADEGFFIGYSWNSKAFRVFNSRTRIVEENLHIRFSESIPNVVASGPDWLFDIDALTRTINYEPIVAGTWSNGFTGTKASDNASQARKET